jgi:hypothetical protein
MRPIQIPVVVFCGGKGVWRVANEGDVASFLFRYLQWVIEKKHMVSALTRKYGEETNEPERTRQTPNAHRQGNMSHFPLTVMDEDGLGCVTTIEIGPGRILVITHARVFLASDIQTLTPLEGNLPSLERRTIKKPNGCLFNSVSIDGEPRFLWATSGLAHSRDQITTTVYGVARYELVTRRGTVLVEHTLRNDKQPDDPPRPGHDYSTPLLRYMESRELAPGWSSELEDILTTQAVYPVTDHYLKKITRIIDDHVRVPDPPIWQDSAEIREKCDQERLEDLMLAAQN